MPERLWADGLDLDSLSTWIGLESNRWSVPGAKGENVLVPARHGALHVNSKSFMEGEFALQFHVNGDNVFELSRNVDDLLRVITRRNGLIHFEHERADGNRIECYAECITAFDIQRTSSALPFSMFTAEFRVPDAFWRDQVLRTSTSPNGLEEGQGVYLPELAGGTAPMDDAVYLFHGPIEEPELRVVGTGAFVRLNGVTLSSDQTWRIDASRWTSSVGTNVSFGGGGDSVVGKTVHGGSASFVDIPPFAEDRIALEVGGHDIGVSAYIEAQGRRKFLIGG